MKRKALFIVNPISGGRKKDDVPGLIRRHLDVDVFDYTIVFTNSVAHARELAFEAVDKYDLITAVGGDGTVNEVASALVGTNSLLGIIPCGSGNGLSRFLDIPMDIKKAIENLNTGHTELIDSAEVNGQPFFNMAGIGFDAHISQVFAHNKKRGFITYIKSSIMEVAKYKPQHYHIEIDGRTYELDAFMLSIANSSQYGNDMHISPCASVQDGLLDVCIIKPFPLYSFPQMGLRMLFKTTDKSKYVEIIRGEHIIIKRIAPGPIHLDGEPQIAGTDIKINVRPGSLKVIVGAAYKS
ncbi:MAG: diacylglycerol kinase family protein [Mucilaginibacter sp.]